MGGRDRGGVSAPRGAPNGTGRPPRVTKVIGCILIRRLDEACARATLASNPIPLSHTGATSSSPSSARLPLPCQLLLPGGAVLWKTLGLLPATVDAAFNDCVLTPSSTWPSSLSYSTVAWKAVLLENNNCDACPLGSQPVHLWHAAAVKGVLPPVPVESTWPWPT